MTPFDPFEALALPESTLVDRRVPKSLFMENGEFAATDQRRIRDGVEELRWLAALKPSTVGIAEYRDAVREYLEIAVLKLELRPSARGERLIELVHRAVPYPVLLIARRDGVPELSLADKRRSLGSAERFVIDGEVICAQASTEVPDKLLDDFRKSLALARQPNSTLKDLYQGWINSVHSFQAAKITGVFRLSPTPAAANDRKAALREYWNLSEKIARIRSLASKEKQMARRAEYNTELACLRAHLESARTRC